jgi:hypothetical protein
VAPRKKCASASIETSTWNPVSRCRRTSNFDDGKPHVRVDCKRGAARASSTSRARAKRCARIPTAERDASACNADRTDLFTRDGNLKDLRVPASDYARCVSPFGVRHMAGNLEEFVAMDGPRSLRPAMKAPTGNPAATSAAPRRPRTTHTTTASRLVSAAARMLPRAGVLRAHEAATGPC